MDFDLGSRGSKLQKEQERRKLEARKKLEQERRASALAAQQAEQIQAQLKQKRLELARMEQEKEKAAEELQRRTAGINYYETLRAVKSKTDSGDKITLPISALETLSAQDATSLGPMLFELSVLNTSSGSNSGSRTTHGGVLEFVAEEGTVGLPLKVIRSLGLNPEAEHLGSMTVRYVRLPKATFVRVVPTSVGLSQVSELRAMLEHNLRLHATCTVGDWLEVWYRGRQFELQVVEAKPENAVLLIDADVELDLDLPAEAQAAMTEKAASDKAKTLRAHMDTAATTAGATTGATTGATLGGIPAANVSADMSDSDYDSDSSSSSSGRKRERVFDADAHRIAKAAGLPSEPGSDVADVITVQIRSRGSKLSRRFLRSDKLAVLFDYCEAAAGAIPQKYRLVTTFPRRVLLPQESSQTTFTEAGLVSKQEAVILESI